MYFINFSSCVEIQTLYPEINNRGSAVGRIVVREIRYNVTIDFEEFEMLYLAIRVRDLNTEIGEDFDECKFFILINFIFISKEAAGTKGNDRFDGRSLTIIFNPECVNTANN